MRKPLFVHANGQPSLLTQFPASTIQELADIDTASIAFLILDISDQQIGYQLLQQIRSCSDLSIYLKPVLFYGPMDNISREVIQAADGYVNITETEMTRPFESWAARFESINTRIEAMREINQAGDSNFALKVLRFIHTRQNEVKPIPSAKEISGYIFPCLQPLFPKKDIGVLETLDYLESQKLVTGTLVNHSYACTHCGCAFLNFFETCPDCGSGELRSEELLHHFRCAYVGEMSDYHQGNRLVCPKCDRQLKHIGVDYDKTSVVFHCKSCSNTFQEPKVLTSCYDCWRETEPENQFMRSIKSYIITSLGDNAAQFGMESLLQTILKKKIHTIPYDVFKEFLRLEVARISRYDVSTSCLAILRLEGIEQIYGKLGRQSSEVFAELSEAFKAELRTSDIFSVKEETIFLTIFTETTSAKAQLATDRLKKRVISLLESNLGMELSLDRRVIQLSDGLDLDKVVENFLQSNAVS